MKPKLALFLELGGSFEEWNEVGFFSREITLYNRLAKDFFGEIYIFTYGSDKDLEYSASLEKNIFIIPRGKRSRSYLINFLYELWLPFKHRHILKRCDIFKTNQNSGSFAASIAKLLFPSKKLVIRSGYIGSELARRAQLPIPTKIYYFLIERISYALCDYAFIPTEGNLNILSRKYPFLKKKISILNNFIQTDLFRPMPESEKSYDIIYVARFDRDKNHSSILKAVKDLPLKLLFVGSGNTIENIHKQIKNGSFHLSILSSIPNNGLPSYYNSSKICAFPSLHEGNPKALLEAMACGLPIVALPSPGIINIISHEKNGLLVPEDRLRESILRLLNDPELCGTLGKEARKTVLDSYSFEKIIDQEISIYRQLLDL